MRDSTEHEKNLLATCLFNHGAFVRASEVIVADDFDHPFHRELWSIMMSLDVQGIAPLADTVAANIRASASKIPPTLPHELASSAISASAVTNYIQSLKSESDLRKLYRIACETKDEALTSRDASATLEAAEAKIAGIRDRKLGAVVLPIASLVKKNAETYDGVKDGSIKPGIPTGFASVDGFVGGLRRKKAYIVGAATSQGKTALALSMIQHVAKTQAVLLFSMEMDAAEISVRLTSMKARINANRFNQALFSAAEVDRWEKAANDVGAYRLRVVEGSQSMAGVRSISRRIASTYGVDLVVIDHLQFVDRPKGASSVAEAMGAITKGVKQLAIDLDVPVLALSQVNRATAGEAPSLWNLRDSGTIEQDADVVMLLYRAAHYDPNHPKPDGAQLDIAKNRGGPTGVIEMRFVKEFALFEDLVEHGTDVEKRVNF